MLLSPALDAAEVVKERQVVIEELRMYQDNPQDYVQIAFDALMWPDHPLGWDVAGREETVLSFTAGDCRASPRATPAAVDAGGQHRRRFRDRRTPSRMIDEALGPWADTAPREGGGAASRRRHHRGRRSA